MQPSFRFLSPRVAMESSSKMSPRPRVLKPLATTPKTPATAVISPKGPTPWTTQLKLLGTGHFKLMSTSAQMPEEAPWPPDVQRPSKQASITGYAVLFSAP